MDGSIKLFQWILYITTQFDVQGVDKLLVLFVYFLLEFPFIVLSDEIEFFIQGKER